MLDNRTSTTYLRHMNNALPALLPACLGCRSASAELTDGYCDEQDECRRKGLEIDTARRIERAEAEALRWSDEHGFALEGV